MTDNLPIPPDTLGSDADADSAELDQGNRYLAEALRKSFGVLSVIMIVLLGCYLLSGIFTVKTDEKAVILRFGEIVGATAKVRGEVVSDGLYFGWPFPIDEVVRVPTSKQTLRLESFWHYEKPGQSGKPEHEKSADSKGLRPRFDGALITGDQGLIHVIWDCEYQIGAEVDDVLNYVCNVDEPTELLASAIENASIVVAASYPAEALTQSNPGFRDKVRLRAQAMLNRLESGIRITALAGTHAPPLQTLRAFQEVTVANQQRERMIQAAREAATKITQDVAGGNWPNLVAAIESYEADDDPTVRSQRLAAIMDLLHDDATKGQARKLIEDAEAYSSRAVGQARQAYEEYSKLLATYKANPDMTVSRLWTETLEEIFASEAGIKLHFPNQAKYVLYPQLDPSVFRKMERTRTQKISESLGR